MSSSRETSALSELPLRGSSAPAGAAVHLPWWAKKVKSGEEVQEVRRDKVIKTLISKNKNFKMNSKMHRHLVKWRQNSRDVSTSQKACSSVLAVIALSSVDGRAMTDSLQHEVHHNNLSEMK